MRRPDATRGSYIPARDKIIISFGSPFGSPTPTRGMPLACENSGRSGVRTYGPSLVRRNCAPESYLVKSSHLRSELREHGLQ